jgi:hypothetical protein
MEDGLFEMLKPLLFTSLLIVLGALGAERAIAAERCRPNVHQSGAPSFLQVTARRNARVSWSARVGSFYGYSYAKWSRAKNRKITCLREHRRYVCRASARPCRPF